MMFTKAPISISHTNECIFLYSQKGLFMIDNPYMIILLTYIENRNYIHKEQITELWSKDGDESIDVEEAINYLIEDVQVLLEMNPDFEIKKIHYIDDGSLSNTAKNILFLEKNTISQEVFLRTGVIDSKAIYVVDMLKYSDYEKTELIQRKLPNDAIVIFLFTVGDHLIISHSYSKKILTPCILCLYDYVMDNIYADRKNKISSLSEVIDYINNHYQVKAPGACICELDYFYLLRELEQYLLTLTGNGRSAFTGCDINSAKIININTLEKKDLVIPYSPKCNCLHLYHQNEGYMNA